LADDNWQLLAIYRLLGLIYCDSLTIYTVARIAELHLIRQAAGKSSRKADSWTHRNLNVRRKTAQNRRPFKIFDKKAGDIQCNPAKTFYKLTDKIPSLKNTRPLFIFEFSYSWAQLFLSSWAQRFLSSWAQRRIFCVTRPNYSGGNVASRSFTAFRM